MIEQLTHLDTTLFRWVNSHYCTVMDWTMWTVSQHWSWLIVIVAAMLPLVVVGNGERSAWKVSFAEGWWMAVAGVALCFLLADHGSVHLFKDTVCRLRPCHALEDVRMFRTNCGGQYGFVSSHAANAFAIIVFLCLNYKERGCRTAPILLVLWGLITCYSRAYLGKHYPGDLLCGAIFGALIGLIVWWFTKKMKKKLHIGETK